MKKNFALGSTIFLTLISLVNNGLMADKPENDVSYQYQNQTQDWNLSNSGMSGSTSNIDYSITQKIREQLKNDTTLSIDAQNVLVSVTDRNVILTGSVKSNNEKIKVESIVHKVSGVRRVTNNLKISK